MNEEDIQVFVSFPYVPPELINPPEISPPWHLLPHDLLRKLNSEHGIPVQDMRLTCQDWRAAFEIPPLKLLVTYEDANLALNVFGPLPVQSWFNNYNYTCDWSKMDFKLLMLPHPAVIGSNKVFVGCCYGYLISVDDLYEVHLVNPYTRNIINLPVLDFLNLGPVDRFRNSDPEKVNFRVVLLCNPGISIFFSHLNKWKRIESKFFYSDVSFTEDLLCAMNSSGTSLHVWTSQDIAFCLALDSELNNSFEIKYPMDFEKFFESVRDIKNAFQCNKSSLVLTSQNKLLHVIPSYDSFTVQYSFHLFEYDVTDRENRIDPVPVHSIGNMSIFLGLNKGKIVPSDQYGVQENSIYFISDWQISTCPCLGIYSLATGVSRLFPLPNGTIPCWSMPFRYADLEDDESLNKDPKDETGSDQPSKRSKSDVVPSYAYPKPELPESTKDSSSLASEKTDGCGGSVKNAASLNELDLLISTLNEPAFFLNLSAGPSAGELLTWHKQLGIALVFLPTRGLEYLHEHCKPSVINRSCNILLEPNFNAKVN